MRGVCGVEDVRAVLAVSVDTGAAGCAAQQRGAAVFRSGGDGGIDRGVLPAGERGAGGERRGRGDRVAPVRSAGATDLPGTRSATVDGEVEGLEPQRCGAARAASGVVADVSLTERGARNAG